MPDCFVACDLELRHSGTDEFESRVREDVLVRAEVCREVGGLRVPELAHCVEIACHQRAAVICGQRTETLFFLAVPVPVLSSLRSTFESGYFTKARLALSGCDRVRIEFVDGSKEGIEKS